MPQELRISAVVTVPDGVFESARVIFAADHCVKAFQDKLTEAVGADNVRHDVDLVTPRARVGSLAA